MVVPLAFHSTFVLGSTSPRRKELLSSIVQNFELRSPNIEEIWDSQLNSLEEGVIDLAQQKNEAIYNSISHSICLTADTIVVLEGEVLGKPKNKNEAEQFLGKLSGKTHLVLTGVCIKKGAFTYTFAEKTKVTFYPLSSKIIAHYVENFNPIDKAGAYGIQEWIGTVGVQKMEGCFQNVIGLPIPKLLQELICLKKDNPSW